MVVLITHDMALFRAETDRTRQRSICGPKDRKTGRCPAGSDTPHHPIRRRLLDALPNGRRRNGLPTIPGVGCRAVRTPRQAALFLAPTCWPNSAKRQLRKRSTAPLWPLIHGYCALLLPLEQDERVRIMGPHAVMTAKPRLKRHYEVGGGLFASRKLSRRWQGWISRSTRKNMAVSGRKRLREIEALARLGHHDPKTPPGGTAAIADAGRQTGGAAGPTGRRCAIGCRSCFRSLCESLNPRQRIGCDPRGTAVKIKPPRK